MQNVEGINTVKISEVSKSFNSTKVVDSIFFNLRQGEIFGLIGPQRQWRDTTAESLGTIGETGNQD